MAPPWPAVPRPAEPQNPMMKSNLGRAVVELTSAVYDLGRSLFGTVGGVTSVFIALCAVNLLTQWWQLKKGP